MSNMGVNYFIHAENSLFSWDAGEFLIRQQEYGGCYYE